MIEIEKFEWAIQFQAICLMIFLDAGLLEVWLSIILTLGIGIHYFKRLSIIVRFEFCSFSRHFDHMF